ncbi:phosphatidylinositol-3-phosphate binding protein [Lachancea thermotolerans CBS 6340]|uniref:KLTH0E03916p n=1 Tax=Lachancea thermotolerans (strain ATCC 56472 / CBS 6340 / NRRL Y-8284) TaxID=559295 RepID=C5DHF4_LACTC|nr:KLTH0E03916p [Lachancea thermotolerans CBS 6340]CAR23215.1 KLTH0E03916p [Lachancea thermotolerans CBS 6340]
MNAVDGPGYLDEPQKSGSELNCPVCAQTLHDLAKLNEHLDRIHGFGEVSNEDADSVNTQLTRSRNVVENSSKAAKANRFELKRDHWIKPVMGKSRCRTCSKSLTQARQAINCRRCGEVYCKNHCNLIIKLNSNAEYNPLTGEWCKCCINCFGNRAGYNEFGAVCNKTSMFKELRGSKVEDKQLRKLQLENRFIRLANGIQQINNQSSKSMLASIRKYTEINKLERSVVPWTPDEAAFACSLCSKPFTLALRKHHCRLCGKVVCNESQTNCSNQLPLMSLIRAASDLPISTEFVDNNAEDVQIRICSACVRILFIKRKFTRELSLPEPSILRIYENMRTTADVILSILPQVLNQAEEFSATPNAPDVALLTKMRRKLLDSFALYDRLTKQMLKIKPKNPAEERIQRAIVFRASMLIQEHMLPLRSLTNAASTQNSSHETTPESERSMNQGYGNNLSIKEVKEYRDQLMVLKEQKFLVENMIASASKQRKFDEAETLSGNLRELNEQVEMIARALGEEGFS